MRGTKRPAAGDFVDRDDAVETNTPQINRIHRSRLKQLVIHPPPSLLHPITPRLPPTPKTPRLPKPKTPFNIFKAIIRHPNLFFQFALRLSITSIIDLYAIDKEFHWRFNKYSTSIMYDYARYHAQDAAFVFSWTLYFPLTISDPLLKPMDNRQHLARDAPSFRWARMIIYKENIVKEILSLLAVEGHRVPQGTARVLMKFWLLMETNTQSMREGFLQDPTIWTDAEILLLHVFLVKLDMRFAEPLRTKGRQELARLLLMQKSLTHLRDYLSGSEKLEMNYDELSEMVARTYPEDELDEDNFPWFDDDDDPFVSDSEPGILSREGWEMDGEHIESALDLVIMEGLSRTLHFQKYYADFVTYGNVNVETGQSLPMPRKWRGEEKVVAPERAFMEEEEGGYLINRLGGV